MKKLTPMILAVIIATFSSCVNSKWVYKGNKFYDIDQVDDGAGSRINKITTYTVTKGFKADIEIKDDDGYLIITPDSVSTAFWDTGSVRKSFKVTGWRAGLLGDGYYFPEKKHVPDSNKKRRFIYFDSKPQLQALTIPIKVRPKLGGSHLDSIPQQAETGFNLDVAFGWKFNLFNIYNGKKGLFGQTQNTWSLTPGIFCGLGTTDLNSNTTRNPIIAFDRSAPTLSTGGFLMLGFNNVNIGGAIGFDRAMGLGGKEWIYQNQLWYGLIFGFDILK